MELKKVQLEMVYGAGRDTARKIIRSWEGYS